MSMTTKDSQYAGIIVGQKEYNIFKLNILKKEKIFIFNWARCANECR